MLHFLRTDYELGGMKPSGSIDLRILERWEQDSVLTPVVLHAEGRNANPHLLKQMRRAARVRANDPRRVPSGQLLL